jgi:PIN domain nuclease of toxin-antitoxin system
MYLLDTHILLWWLANDPRLSKTARICIANPAHKIFVSAVSIWEIAVKKSLGKLSVPDNFIAATAKAGFEALPVTFAHAMRVVSLPLHHNDPFDRLLIAQALEQGFVLITQDEKVHQYPLKCLK